MSTVPSFHIDIALFLNFGALQTLLFNFGHSCIDVMIKFASLDRCILLSIQRNSVPLRLPISPPTEHFISRAFSSSISRPSNARTSVSFGPDTDAAISPYLDKLGKGNWKRGRSTRTQTETGLEAPEKTNDLSGEGHRQLLDREDVPNYSRGVVATADGNSDADTAIISGTYNENAIEKEDSLSGFKNGHGELTASRVPKQMTQKAVLDSSENSGKRVTHKASRGKPEERAANHYSLLRPTSQARYPKEQWQLQKAALAKKFKGENWSPRKKLSPDAIEGLRDLNAENPEKYDTATLAQAFKISPEAVRRILKSKWKPDSEKMDERRERWAKRHDRIWDRQSELGLRPPRQREKSVEDPEEFDRNIAKKEKLGEI